MDKELIERLAKKAGIQINQAWGTCFTGNVQLVKFAVLVAEECAKVCEAKSYTEIDMMGGNPHARDIRAKFAPD